MKYEKRNQIIRALTSKSLTWNELLQETKLSKATLSRYLNWLISENTVHKLPTLYSLSNRIDVIIPQKIVLVNDVKRVKTRVGSKGKRMKLIPIITARESNSKK